MWIKHNFINFIYQPCISLELYPQLTVQSFIWAECRSGTSSGPIVWWLIMMTERDIMGISHHTHQKCAWWWWWDFISSGSGWVGGRFVQGNGDKANQSYQTRLINHTAWFGSNPVTWSGQQHCNLQVAN